MFRWTETCSILTLSIFPVCVVELYICVWIRPSSHTIFDSSFIQIQERNKRTIKKIVCEDGLIHTQIYNVAFDDKY
jgi:hypothetical protein